MPCGHCGRSSEYLVCFGRSLRKITPLDLSEHDVVCDVVTIRVASLDVGGWEGAAVHVSRVLQKRFTAESVIPRSVNALMRYLLKQCTIECWELLEKLRPASLANGEHMLRICRHSDAALE